MKELERTFLVKSLPKDLFLSKSKEIIDIYLPASHDHPVLRLRKNGDKFEMTKKQPLDDDASEQEEQTIKLSKHEFEELLKLPGKKVRKIRYFHEYKQKIAEFDVFQDSLKGLVLVDFEFDTKEHKAVFAMPEFCLVEVTHEDFIAGGKLCGKGYEDIEERLKMFGYSKLNI
jgi:CYTH domain-containing protein